VVWQKPSYSFLLELKTSWNETDVAQIAKYAKSPGRLREDNTVQAFGENHCVLLGYQNTPGDSNLEKLFDRWEKEGFGFPLVVFRYGLERAAPGEDRISISRAAYRRNGECPLSYLGKVMNSARGISVSASRFKFVRSKFHKANDQVIASYAAVIWWAEYAEHYLTDDQKAEMAARGHLSSPLVIPVDKLGEIPIPPHTEVPLGPRDVKHAMEFLRQAKLVTLKKRARVYEIELKEDRYIRLPIGTPLDRSNIQQELATKIIARWAEYSVKRPVPAGSQKAKIRKPRRRKTRDSGSGFLPFPDTSS
jgi:hypothetical protein